MPDAATGCTNSADFKVWTCKLKPGLKFSNGDPLTSKDVKWSIDRVVKIADPNGPSSLIGTARTGRHHP